MMGKWTKIKMQWADMFACLLFLSRPLLVGIACWLQKKKELIILGMAGGMYEQRVLVEYLQELEERVKAAFGIEQEKKE